MISVVYDGPPEAGKTTTVRALARGFGREVYTPEERDGRTVHFDWLEHIGGRFEGSPIRCQIVSVPGQKRWVRRRAHFLERADVVVFVGDTTTAAWPETVARLEDLRADLDARRGPAVGLVFQANKRDCADAVPLDAVRARAANARTAVVESSARDGTGVREAFVFAVRLALDRVRDLHRLDPARSRSGARAGFGAEGTDLYELLRRVDVEADRGGPAVVQRGATRPPSHDAPCGFVWPPIEGRILLRDAAPPPDSAVDVGPAGDFSAGANSGWIVHSGAAAVFVDLDDARGVLIDWARQHAAAQSVLSRRRCIVLAESGDGRWRLWQIVRREASLRQLTAVAPVLAERLLTEAAAACARSAVALPVTLDTIGAELERPVYVGLMPVPTARTERG